VVKGLAPGLPAETAALAAKLTAIMMPTLIFLGLRSLFTGLLNANNVFGLPAFYAAFIQIVRGETEGRIFSIMSFLPKRFIISFRN